jgi:glycosyltransferase involved in cell wall biosynthesis
VNVAFASFRLAGTDGVSLETAKVAQIVHRLGHRVFYCAGEFDPPGESGPLSVPLAGSRLIEAMHFTHPEIVWITEHAFGTPRATRDLRERIERATAYLKAELEAFLDTYAIGVLVAENVFAIPLNLPLSIALRQVIAERGLPCLAHNHDFYWERERFAVSGMGDVLVSTFPPNLPQVRQLVINSQAQRALAERSISSQVLPNIFDYATEPPGIDAYNADLRRELGVQPGELFFLQPTRVVRRKGIELAIELVSRLRDLPIKLYITHHAEFDTLGYLEEIMALAARLNVPLRYVPLRFAPERMPGEGADRIYSLWDAYIHADFVTYPSLYEGFGNALLETLYFRRPLLVNRYQVYQDDIEPTGIEAVAIDGAITEAAVDAVRALLDDPIRANQITARNYARAREHFSYEAVTPLLDDLLKSTG